MNSKVKKLKKLKKLSLKNPTEFYYYPKNGTMKLFFYGGEQYEASRFKSVKFESLRKLSLGSRRSVFRFPEEHTSWFFYEGGQYKENELKLKIRNSN